MSTPENGGNGGGSEAGRNMWDAAIALIVIGALVALVVILVVEYSSADDVIKVLGVAAPVLAAAFGVSIGYYTGTKTGESAGEKKGKAKVAGQLKSVISKLDSSLDSGILNPITTEFESTAGRDSFQPASGRAPEIPQQAIDETREAVALLRAIEHANR